MSANNILTILTKNLDGKVSRNIYRRVDAMRRNINYLLETQNKHLIYIQEKGITLEKLDVACCLNSFYQFVLGPLSSSAYTKSTIGIGDEIPLNYGNIRFDQERMEELKKTHHAFRGVLEEIGIPFSWLYFNRVDELIYYIWKKTKERDGWYE